MILQQFGISSKAAIKQFASLFVCVTLLFGFAQMPARAATTPSGITFAPNLPIALVASSRFAAQTEAEGQEPMISASQLDAMKEQRREWQSEVSAAAAAESEVENPKNEGVKDKLNLDEITETMTNTENQRSR